MLKRRLKKKTDYRKRFKLLSSGLPRLVIRKSLENISVQFIEWKSSGDIVRASAHSRQLLKFGWAAPRGNSPAAYLTGLLAGLKAKKVGINKAVLDLGLQTSTKGSRLYAALKGVLDAGIDVPHSEKILPDESRIAGEHIASWSQRAPGFSLYKIRPADLPAHFKQIKEKIIKGV